MGFLKKAVTGIYKKGVSAIDDYVIDPATNALAAADPTGVLDVVDSIKDAAIPIIRDNPEEAAQIAVALYTGNPGLAKSVALKLVVEELERRAGGTTAQVEVAIPREQPPAQLRSAIPQAPAEGQMAMPPPQQMQPAPSRMAVTFWYWAPEPFWPVVRAVCPYWQMSYHEPLFVPAMYFWFTRGKWNQCGYCGNWSFTS